VTVLTYDFNCFIFSNIYSNRKNLQYVVEGKLILLHSDAKAELELVDQLSMVH
jgi:hypothetical protein